MRYIPVNANDIVTEEFVYFHPNYLWLWQEYKWSFCVVIYDIVGT